MDNHSFSAGPQARPVTEPVLDLIQGLGALAAAGYGSRGTVPKEGDSAVDVAVRSGQLFGRVARQLVEEIFYVLGVQQEVLDMAEHIRLV
jgi:hypothetical protein